MQASDGGKRWYDAVWLAKYIEAKEIVARVSPRKLNDFLRTFDVLRPPPGYSAQRFVPGFLSDEQLASIRETIRQIPMDKLETHELKEFGRFIVHNWPEFTALHATLADQVSDLAGELVEPTYNFLSLYTKMGVCQPHLDAPSAKWTLDICIDQSEPWPISFSQTVSWPETLADLKAISFEEIKANSELHFRDEVLRPGDAILFSGTNQWHYRDELPKGSGRRYCELLFFHFVPRGAAPLTQPKNWAEIFAIPELAEISDLDRVY